MKRSVITIVVCILAALSANAQLTRDLSSFSPLKSPNQQIIEQVVNSGVFIVKQSYELADSVDNRYGLSGNKEFDIDYTLAVKIKNGFLVSERTVHPWDFNSRFDQYRGVYTPKLFPSQFTEVGSQCRYDSITIDESKLRAVFSGMLYAQESEQFFNDGFALGGNIGENDGWIVWFTKKKGTHLSISSDLNVSIIQKKLNISHRDNESYFYQIDSLTTSDEIVGGIFLIPEVISVGHMELKLCGVVCRIDNGWMLCCPFINSKNILETNDNDNEKISETESKEPKLTLNQKSDEVYNLAKKNKTKKKR
jgi:hypothetical protein